MADLLPLVQSLRVDVIVVALEDQRGHLPIEDLLRCRVEGIRVEDAPSFFERLTGKILVSDLRPSWLVFSPGFSKPRLLRSSKRAAELVAALALLVVTSPLLGLLSVLIRLESRGPALYRQLRVGLRGAVFALHKLRTMREDAEAGLGSRLGRPRVGPPDHPPRPRPADLSPGRAAPARERGERRDELRGPRPERPHFVQTLRLVIPYYDERHSVRPGSPAGPRSSSGTARPSRTGSGSSSSTSTT